MKVPWLAEGKHVSHQQHFMRQYISAYNVPRINSTTMSLCSRIRGLMLEKATHAIMINEPHM